MKRIIAAAATVLLVSGCAAQAAEPEVVTETVSTTETVTAEVTSEVTVTAQPAVVEDAPADDVSDLEAQLFSCQMAMPSLIEAIGGLARALDMNDQILGTEQVADALELRTERDAQIENALNEWQSVEDFIDICRDGF